MVSDSCPHEALFTATESARGRTGGFVVADACSLVLFASMEPNATTESARNRSTPWKSSEAPLVNETAFTLAMVVGADTNSKRVDDGVALTVPALLVLPLVLVLVVNALLETHRSSPAATTCR